MARFSNAFRGGNVCHRIQLPRFPRRFPSTGEGVAELLQNGAFGRERREPSGEPRILEAEYEVLDGATVAKAELDVARARQAVLEQALADETLASAAQGAAYRRELALLERRLEKLRGALATREEELRKVLASPAAETGVASRFREVQGLDVDSAEAGRKREMLSQIFAANCKLQKDLAGIRTGAR